MLVLTVRTARPVGLRGLDARPDTRRAAARYLCLALHREGGRGGRRLCLGGRKPWRRLGLVRVNARGKPLARGAVRARLKRPGPRLLVAAFVPADAGLAPRRYGWRLLASRGCEVRRRCARSLPEPGELAFRLRPVRAVGCTGGGTGLVSNGPRDRMRVALTFDDGPSSYTPAFLDVLRDKGARATFFEVGQVMPGHEATMRRILAEGHELANHTMDHVEHPGYSQIAGASARITASTRFKPCLFRPPGGAVDSSVLATAGGLGMLSVNWDVDPRDWTNAGGGAIYSNVVGHVRPGSIVVLHDGGGPRSQTLAALPQIIDTLRSRGYAMVTVSELLGHRLVYRPSG